jgi:hypothetical protein
MLATSSSAGYSISSSARSKSVSGIVRPISFAVFRLMISSNLVGSWTGKSLGFSPGRNCRQLERPRPRRNCLRDRSLALSGVWGTVAP